MKMARLRKAVMSVSEFPEIQLVGRRVWGLCNMLVLLNTRFNEKLLPEAVTRINLNFVNRTFILTVSTWGCIYPYRRKLVN